MATSDISETRKSFRASIPGDFSAGFGHYANKPSIKSTGFKDVRSEVELRHEACSSWQGGTMLPICGMFFIQRRIGSC